MKIRFNPQAKESNIYKCLDLGIETLLVTQLGATHIKANLPRTCALDPQQQVCVHVTVRNMAYGCPSS